MLSLSITGFDADPDRVSQLLQLDPSSIGRKGESTKSGSIRKVNGWWLELHELPITDGRQHDDAIAELIKQLSGREHLFSELRATLRPKSISVYGGFYVSDEQQGVWLEPSQMAVLAACGIGWSLDLFEAQMLD